VTRPPSGAAHASRGVFPFIIEHGMRPTDRMHQGDTRTCSIRVSDEGRVFGLDGVHITYVRRSDAEVVVGGRTYVDTTFVVYFTEDFWSQRYQFHGLGGSATQVEYHFPRRPR
jgi:hypothetical protein